MESTAPEDAVSLDSDVFRALAAESRRQILVLLAGGEASVGELAAGFEISRPAVSKHLATLKRADLVEVRSEGRRNVYRLNREPLTEVLEWLVVLDCYWAGHLEEINEWLDDER